MAGVPQEEVGPKMNHNLYATAFGPHPEQDPELAMQEIPFSAEKSLGISH